MRPAFARRRSTRRALIAIAVLVCVPRGTLLTTPRQASSPPVAAGALNPAGAQRTSPCPGCGFAPEPIAYGDVTGWTQIFDGKTLDGWDGNPAVWKADAGAITAESTAERRVGTTYIIWRGG